MAVSALPGRTFRFGAFEANERAGELRKHGVRIRLQEQPFQILILLLDRVGEIVEREEIRNKLWPENTFVDFDNAISSAVRKVRDTLGDSADNPRFIETVARRGYRFIAQIEVSPPVVPVPEPRQNRIKTIPIVAGAILSFAGAGLLWFWSGSRPRPEQLTPLPLTAVAGIERHPSFSPDGSQIAYAWEEEPGTGGISHIYVKWIGSGKPVQLTSGPSRDTSPAWSPDGRTLAFLRFFGPEPDVKGAIYLIPPLGGAERKVAELSEVAADERINWSPDSRFLAVSDQKSTVEATCLYLVSLGTGEKMRLTAPPDTKSIDSDPVFSPDGKTLLFVRCQGLHACGLYLLALPADYRPVAPPRPLVAEPASILGAAWTTDGRGVVYGASIDAGLHFYLMRRRIGSAVAPQRLDFAGESAFWPVMAPRGNRLAYVHGLGDSDILQIRQKEPPRSFASSTRFEYGAQYSPDGKHVVFSSNRSGQTQIWVSDEDGGNQTQLTSFAEHCGSPRWSPDGRFIVFNRHVKEGWKIFVMASDGGRPRQLTSDSGDEIVPSWSRSGKWIYYASNKTGRFEVWKAPAQGGKGVQITRNGGTTALESHDGETLYYKKIPDFGRFPLAVDRSGKCCNPSLEGRSQ